MYTLELSHEELDCICQALNDAARGQNNDEIAEVYEKLRQGIRAKHPLNSSMAKLVADLKGQDDESEI